MTYARRKLEEVCLRWLGAHPDDYDPTDEQLEALILSVVEDCARAAESRDHELAQQGSYNRLFGIAAANVRLLAAADTSTPGSDAALAVACRSCHAKPGKACAYVHASAVFCWLRVDDAWRAAKVPPPPAEDNPA